MPIFENADELYACIGGMFEKVKSHPQMKEMWTTLKLAVQFTYTQPEASIMLVSCNGEQSIYYGDCDVKPDIELAMTGDVAHQFWIGEINPMSAIAQRQVVLLGGSLMQIMKLTPMIKLGVQIYPAHYQQFLSEHPS